MRILNITSVDDNSEEITIDLTNIERKKIKDHYGWKRLTKKRIEKWFNEIIKNTIEREKNV